VAQTCFYHLCRIHAVRRQLGRDVTARLVTALVLLHLDYCNAVLAGLPAYYYYYILLIQNLYSAQIQASSSQRRNTLAPLQRVLHAVARTVMDLKPHDSSVAGVALVASR